MWAFEAYERFDGTQVGLEDTGLLGLGATVAYPILAALWWRRTVTLKSTAAGLALLACGGLHVAMPGVTHRAAELSWQARCFHGHAGACAALASRAGDDRAAAERLHRRTCKLLPRIEESYRGDHTAKRVCAELVEYEPGARAFACEKLLEACDPGEAMWCTHALETCGPGVYCEALGGPAGAPHPQCDDLGAMRRRLCQRSDVFGCERWLEAEPSAAPEVCQQMLVPCRSGGGGNACRVVSAACTEDAICRMLAGRCSNDDCRRLSERCVSE